MVEWFMYCVYFKKIDIGRWEMLITLHHKNNSVISVFSLQSLLHSISLIVFSFS